jgi:hypothetical protein
LNGGEEQKGFFVRVGDDDHTTNDERRLKSLDTLKPFYTTNEKYEKTGTANPSRLFLLSLPHSVLFVADIVQHFLCVTYTEVMFAPLQVASEKLNKTEF